MIIDSKKYNGACSSGKNHAMVTEYCIIEAGCLKDFTKIVAQHGLSGYSVAIYDENTYLATKGVRPNASYEIVLPPENLHADNHGVALAEKELPKKCDYLIAVGSGTVHDITRYIAHKYSIPFVSCPTAASVDGFCSSVAAMTWDGFKKTFTAVAPKIVIADLSVIVNAPNRLTKSGFGDMIGKFIALTDWKISNILTNGYFCQTIYDMTMDATKAVLDSADGVIKKDVSAYKKLMYGLLISGLAMQLLGNSRCASGAEHHISHFIEMNPVILNVSSNALHGEKVGVGTLIACDEYRKIIANKNPDFYDYTPVEDSLIEEVFGEILSQSIIQENKENCISGITAKLLKDNWAKICDIVLGIPTCEELLEKYRALGLNENLSDIEVPVNALDNIIKYSPLVRNRITLMRLRSLIK